MRDNRIHPPLSLPKWTFKESCGEFLDTDDELAWEVAAPAFKADILQLGIINRKNHVRAEYTIAQKHLLILMLQGILHIRMDGATKRLKPGDMASIPAGTFYLKTGVDKKSFSHIHIKISDTDRWNGLKSRGPWIRPYESAEYLYLLIWRIYGATQIRDVIAIDSALRDSYSLVDLLMGENRITTKQQAMESLALRGLVSQIRNNPSLSWNNEDMAASVNMSERTFLRTFKREFGTTPKTMVVKQRMILARRLLEFTGDKVEKVAQEVGYANRSVFSELFFKHVGVRPANIRKHPELDE